MKLNRGERGTKLKFRDIYRETPQTKKVLNETRNHDLKFRQTRKTGFYRRRLGHKTESLRYTETHKTARLDN